MIFGVIDKLVGIFEDDLEENGGGVQSILRVWSKWSLFFLDESSLKENLVENAVNVVDDYDFFLQVVVENGFLYRKNIISLVIQLLFFFVVENERSYENFILVEIEGREEIFVVLSV